MFNISPHAQPKFLVELGGEQKLGYLSANGSQTEVCLDKRCFVDYFDGVTIDVSFLETFQQQIRVKVFDCSKVYWNCFLEAGFETRCYCSSLGNEQTNTCDGFQEEWFDFEGYGNDGVWGNIPENGWLPCETDLHGFKPAVFENFSEKIDSELLYECDYPLVLAFEHVGFSEIELKRAEFYWDSLGNSDDNQCKQSEMPMCSLSGDQKLGIVENEKENFGQMCTQFSRIKVST